MKRALLALSLVATVGTAHALSSRITMELVAITNDVAVVDLHAQECSDAQRSWLVVDLRDGTTTTFMRQTTSADKKPSCAQITTQFAAALAKLHVDGIELDVASCDKHDSAWGMEAKALLDPEFGKTWHFDPKRPNLTKVTKARAQSTIAALAAGTKRSATLEPMYKTRSEAEDHPWFAASPDQRTLVVGDPARRRVTVYAIDDAGRLTKRGPTKAE